MYDQCKVGNGMYTPMDKVSLSRLANKYAKLNNIQFHDPIVLTRDNVMNDDFKSLFNIGTTTVVMVFEERASKVSASKVTITQFEERASKVTQPDAVVFPLDERQWKNCEINNIHVILPPTKRNTMQAYNVASAAEVHYETSLLEVLTKVRLTNIQMYLYKNDDKNYKSPFCVVNNSQEFLRPFVNPIHPQLLDSFIANFNDDHKGLDGSTKNQDGGASFSGLCSK